VMGIEPTPSAWKAEVLPLNYTRTCSLSRLAPFCAPINPKIRFQTIIINWRRMELPSIIVVRPNTPFASWWRG
jgi:hypothetical protein